MSKNKKSNQTRQDFLLSFFSPHPVYEVVEVNGFFLEKMIDGVSGKKVVAINSRKSWEAKRKYLDKVPTKGNKNGI